MQVLLTNDDGIGAQGLQTLRRALNDVEGIELALIAPDSNRSATGRSITVRRSLSVEEITFNDGMVGYATDGTPVDCVRFAQQGLIDGFVPDLVISGINHGANLGDDISYSGTVAAALEGLVLGVPAIAISQQSLAGEMDFRFGEHFDFTSGADFAVQLIKQFDSIPLSTQTMLNVNVPHTQPTGVELTVLGKRIYRDQLILEDDSAPGRRSYRLYGDEHGYHEQPGSDFAAVAQGRIAVTPIHFDLTDMTGMGALRQFDLNALLG